MGVDDEFGPDTETIRAWLSKRATYAKDARVIGSPRGGASTPFVAPAEHQPPRIEQADVGGIDNVALGRSVLEALADAPTPKPSTPLPAAPDPRASTPEVVRGRWTAPPDDLSTRSTDVDFGTRSGVRRVMTLLLLTALAATGAAAYLANQDPTPALIGIAGTLGFLTVVVWAVRAGCTTTRMTLQRGKLSIERGGATEAVEIGNPYTPIAMIGEPGDRRWTVLVERPGQPLVVITRGMVDPQRFTEALARLRPELVEP